MIRRKKSKNMVLKSANIFKGRTVDDFRFTNHFLDRWNDRMSDQSFESKELLESHIKNGFNSSELEHLWGDNYLLNGVYVTARVEKDGIVFITTLGTYQENPFLYNVISAGQLNKTIKKYGKLDLSFSM